MVKVPTMSSNKQAVFPIEDKRSSCETDHHHQNCHMDRLLIILETLGIREKERERERERERKGKKKRKEKKLIQETI
ncbi:conserved hypothetical protein [Ricinus communis]|uniref:Uncharacterized protein n=1 Tax=Ricinus communis TaxID=3988 RepID=B9T0W9_RICCO|nr:conserved hypothetical protein [Ricinus communis]